MARPGSTQRADVAARRARVLQARIQQIPYAQIAADEDITESTARSDYQRAFEALKRDQLATAAEARKLELGKLDAMEREAWRVLRARHITVQHGKIVGRHTGRFVRDEAGEIILDHNDKPLLEVEEIEDDQPVLQALDRLTRIAQRRHALLGLDAPVRIKAEVDDARRAEIERLALELAAAGVGDLEPGGAGAAPGDAPAGEGGPGTS